MTALLGLAPALAAESTKFRHARVPLVCTAMLVAGISGMSLAILLAARAGDPSAVVKFGPVVSRGGWAALLGTAGQISAVGGLLAFGVTAGWIFGREFTEGTITGLFGLPVGRSALAVAKLVVYAAWAGLVSLATALVLAAVGLVTGLGWPDQTALNLLVRQVLLGLLTALLAVPAGWAATLARTVLAGIAAVIGMVVVAQVLVVAGVGAWFPFAAPGLWASGVARVAPAQLALVVPVGLLAGAMTVRAWARLQLDR